MSDPVKRRPSIIRAAFVFVTAFSLVMVPWLILSKDSPLPQHYNPRTALVVDDPVTFMTRWKFSAALQNDAQCLSVLAASDVAFDPMPDFVASDMCGIAPRVRLSRVGLATLRPVETTCQIALRTAMWERHSLRSITRSPENTHTVSHTGSHTASHTPISVSEIVHTGSYNCRQMRTSSGGNGRMSTHATASALDVSGFQLSDGTTLDLKRDWGVDGAEFLRVARDGACDWFGLVLGPDYNALHADHFHLQARGRGLCR